MRLFRFLPVVLACLMCVSHSTHGIQDIGAMSDQSWKELREELNKIADAFDAVSDETIDSPEVKKVLGSFGKNFKEMFKDNKITLREVISLLPAFKKIKLPKFVAMFMDKISFYTPTIKRGKKSIEMLFKGPAAIFGKMDAQARIYVGPGKNGKGFGATLSVGIPGKVSYKDYLGDLVDLMKSLTGGAKKKFLKAMGKTADVTVDAVMEMLDWFQFVKSGVIVAVGKFEDPVWGDVKTGINMRGQAKIAGPIGKVANWFGEGVASYAARGYINPIPLFSGTMVEAVYPGKVNLLKIPKAIHIRTGEFIVGLELMSSALTKGIIPLPTPYISGALEVKLPGQKEFVTFKTELSIGLPVDITLTGQMVGTVKNMFGIPGIDVSDLGIGGGILIEIKSLKPLVFTPPQLKGISFEGKFNVGGNYTKFLLKIPTSVDQGLVGMLEGNITSKNLFQWTIDVMDAGAKLVGKKQDFSKVRKAIKTLPRFDIKDFRAYFAQSKATLFGETYPKGISLEGKANFFGVGGGIKGRLMPGFTSGLELMVYMDEIKVPKKNPLIIITGAGPDGKRNEGIDGPVGKINLSLFKQLFFMDGLLEIPPLKVKQDVHLKMTPLGGLEFDFQTKLAGLFNSEVHVIAGKLTAIKKWLFKAKLQQDGVKFFNNLLTNVANSVAADAQKGMNKAQKDLNKANSDLNRWNSQAKRDIDAWVNLKVRQTDHHIRKTKKEIERLKRNCRKANFFVKAAVCAVEGVKIAALGTKLGVLEAHKRVTLPKIMKTAAREGTNLASSTAKAGIRTAKISIKSGQVAMEAGRRAANFAGKVLKHFQKGVIDITSIEVDGYMKDILPTPQMQTINLFGKNVKVPVFKPGKLPKVRVQAKVFGKKFDQTYQYDLARPDKLVKQVFKGIKQLL